MDLTVIKALILDMDGVLWKGDQPIGNLSATFERVNALGLKFTFVTNNATRTVQQYAQKLRGFGVETKPEQIINSSVATARYLRQRFPNGGNVFVLGETGLVETLAEQGFRHADHDVLAVVAAMDRQLTYEKVRRATLLIRGGALFVATNPDRTFPTPEGLVPGAGAIIALLETATDAHPIIIGKPSPDMYTFALERMCVKSADTLVVGDRLETDIAAGQKIGCWTALMLSGVTTLQQSHTWSPPPDIIVENLPVLLEKFPRPEK